MTDFAGLLRKTIDAQKNATAQLRQRVYVRAREAIGKKLAESDIPAETIKQQKILLENAIVEVEESYLNAEKALLESIIKPHEKTAHDSQNPHSPEHHVSEEAHIVKQKAPEPVTPPKTQSAPAAPRAPEAKHAVKEDASPSASSAKVKKTATETTGEPNSNFDQLGNIFKTQSERKALAEAKRKRRIFWTIASILILVIMAAALLVLNPFTNHRLAPPSGNTQKTAAENAAAQTEKQTQRLLPDGRETNPVPSTQQAQTAYPKSDAEATTVPEQVDHEKATLYLSQTPTQTEKILTGTAEWIVGRDISESGRDLGSIIRGDVSIPVDSSNDKLIMRMTIHPNHDETIPATYITDMIFIVPDNFPEGAVDEVVDFKFKATEQIAGQAMIGTTNTRIGDNFFIFPMSSSGPFAESNLRLMRQMPWVRIVARFKSGRVMELTFNKGEKGKKIFDDVIGEWLNE